MTFPNLRTSKLPNSSPKAYSLRKSPLTWKKDLAGLKTPFIMRFIKMTWRISSPSAISKMLWSSLLTLSEMARGNIRFVSSALIPKNSSSQSSTKASLWSSKKKKSKITKTKLKKKFMTPLSNKFPTVLFAPTNFAILPTKPSGKLSKESWYQRKTNAPRSTGGSMWLNMEKLWKLWNPESNKLSKTPDHIYFEIFTFRVNSQF